MMSVTLDPTTSLQDERKAIQEALCKPGLAPQERENLEERLSLNGAHIGISQALADNELEMLMEEVERLEEKENRRRTWLWYAGVVVLIFVIYKALKTLTRG